MLNELNELKVERCSTVSVPTGWGRGGRRHGVRPVEAASVAHHADPMLNVQFYRDVEFITCTVGDTTHPGIITY